MSPEEESDVEYVKYISIVPTCFKSIIVACATLHFYYTGRIYIWSRKWTVGKIMYLLTRYLGTFFLICSVIGVNVYAWNDPWLYSDKLTNDNPTLSNFIPTCFHGELFAGLGPMIILVAEVILQMRVYALYGRDKRLLVFFILLTISLFGFNIFQMSYLFFDVEEGACSRDGACFRKRSMSRRLFIQFLAVNRYTCLDAISISGIGWAVITFTELLLFLMVIVKARKRLFKSRNRETTHDICASMAKDSVSYFAVMFTVCLFGAVLVLAYERIPSELTKMLSYQWNSYETIAITVITILAPRLIINLREEVYGPPVITESQLSWNADVSGYSSSDGSIGDSNQPDIGGSSSFEPERS